LQEYVAQNAVPMFNNTVRPPAVVKNLAGTKLTAASFSAFNIGAATISDYTNGYGFGFSIPASASASLRGWTIAAPSAPWTLTVWGAAMMEPTLSQFIVGAKETGSAAISDIAFNGDGFVHQTWTAPTTFGTATGLTNASYQPYGFWLQVEDDNVNLVFRASHDGVVWRQIHTEARLNTLSSVDEIFFGGSDTNNDFGILGSVYAWIEE
jgi:hypothetical protein